MATPPPPFTVRPATLADLPTLTTIVPRSFHPTNAYIQNLFPSTPALETWWAAIFASRITLPSPKTSHLLTITATATPSETLGILSLHLFPALSPGAGFYTTTAPTPSHDIPSYAAVESALASARQELMNPSGRAHFAIELFGVDDAFKGQGLGKQLLRRACEIADEAGLEIFVMANASARGVYPKVGFEERKRVVMPGEMGHEEFMLVRPVGGGGRV